MIETLGATAFVIAVLLMCGPQACYNAGSWIGLVLKAFWKVAVWTYGTIKKAIKKANTSTPVQALPAEATPATSNVVALWSASDSPEEKRDGQTIDGIATVL